MARKKTRKTTRKPPVRRAPKAKTSPEPTAEPAGEQPGELIDTDRAIEILKTTRPTFYRWLRSGRLKGMKVGRQWRFRREDLDRFLAGKEPDVHLTADIKPLLGALAKRLKAAGGT